MPRPKGSKKGESKKRKNRGSGEVSTNKRQTTLDSLISRQKAWQAFSAQYAQLEEDNDGSEFESDSTDNDEGDDDAFVLRPITQSGKSKSPSADSDLLRQILFNQEEMISAINRMNKQMRKHQSKIEEQMTTITTLRQEMTSVTSRLSEVEKQLQNTRDSAAAQQQSGQQSGSGDTASLQEHVNRIERKQRERNLRLIGVQESPQEDCYDIVYSVIYDELGIGGTVEAAHRVGRRGPKPRHIIFRVDHVDTKMNILTCQRQYLRDRDYFIVEDLTKQDYNKKRSLKPQIDQARRENKRWSFRNGKLYIDGQYVQGQDDEIGRQREAGVNNRTNNRAPRQQSNQAPRSQHQSRPYSQPHHHRASRDPPVRSAGPNRRAPYHREYSAWYLHRFARFRCRSTAAVGGGGRI